MKTLIICLICTCASMSLFAQVDTTNNMNNGSYNNNNKSTYTDTSGTMNKTNMNNNNVNSNMNSKTDTSAYMNNRSTSTNNSAMNNNWNDSMQNSTAIATQKAALPVLETYVPQNIIDQAKQKFPNGQIYDITAVRSPEDTMAQSSNAMAGTWNSTSNNTKMDQDHDKDDSSMTNQTTMNQNTQNSTNNHSQDSSMNQTSTTAAAVNNNNTNEYANNSRPEKYNYVVRVMQGGQMETQTLTSDGTALNVRSNNNKDGLANQ